MAKKKKNASAGGGFNLKEFLLYHVEKIIFAFIALFSLTLVYLGVTGQKFSGTQTPQDLKSKADTAASAIGSEDRWEAILAEQPERTVTVNYSKIAAATRGEVDVNMYASNIWQKKSVESSLRGDPELRAPIKLRSYFFTGPIATVGTNDIIETFEDAKKPEEKAPTPRRNNRNQNMASGGYGSEMMGSSMDYTTSGPMGSSLPGGPGMPGSASAAALNMPRFLQPAYDLGFKLGQRTYGGMGMGSGYGSGYDSSMGGSGMPGSGMGMSGPGLSGPGMSGPGLSGPGMSGPGGSGPGGRQMRTMIARNFSTVVVTALVEHRELEAAYEAEFMNNYMPGRDNPNYQGFEVQRVVVNNNTKEIAESDWVTIKEASSDGWKEYVKKNFEIGTAAEVSSPMWTVNTLSMDIPPFLLVDYSKFCGHSDVPNVAMDPITDAFFFAPPTNSGGSGFGSGGYGAGGYGAGGYGAGGYGAGGYGGGYPGSGDSSYSMSGPGMGSDYGSGSTDPYGSSSYGSGSDSSYGGSYSSGGYGSGDSSMSGGYSSPGAGGPMMGSPPRKLPSTKYKLVRFFDPTVKEGVSYRYRVRLKMYDPNFPEFEALAPKSIDLKPDALTRVQDLRIKEKPDPTTRKLVSERLTDWSAPSDVVVAVRPVPIYAGELDTKAGQYMRMPASGQAIAVKPPRAELSVADPYQFLHFPLKEKAPVFRGQVIAGDDRPNKLGIEFVNPVSKRIKVPKKKREDGRPFTISFPTNLYSVVDINGGGPLAAWTSKDDMRSGGEIVSFDSSSNQLVISREFEDFTDHNRTIKPDAIPIGPLGGPMGNASMSGGMSGMPGGDSYGYGAGP